MYNHTSASSGYSYLLNGGYASRIGLGKSYHVYPGDVVKINASARYEAGSTTPPTTGFASALLSAFTLGTPAIGETGTASSGVNTWGGMVENGTESSSGIAAYVTIIVFDKHYNYLTYRNDQISSGATSSFDEMLAEYTASEEGYVYMYISNHSSSPQNVYFDDVKMTYIPTNVIQYNEYYPFGLQTENSWTRSGSKNDYKYNAANELNSNTGWYEMFYRGYDPTIGRMLQVDPYATMYSSVSTYNYAMNNPVMMNDPNGGQVKAPPGVSQMGWDRYQKLHERDNPTFLSDWDETFMTGGMVRWADQNAVQKGEMTTSQYLAKHGGYHAKRGQLITVSEVIAETGNPYKLQSGIWYQGGRFLSAEQLFRMGVGKKRSSNSKDPNPYLSAKARFGDAFIVDVLKLVLLDRKAMTATEVLDMYGSHLIKEFTNKVYDDPTDEFDISALSHTLKLYDAAGNLQLDYEWPYKDPADDPLALVFPNPDRITETGSAPEVRLPASDGYTIFLTVYFTRTILE
jgi:RHS repeat-associated protein